MILAEGIQEKGVGFAVMNRLRRAAAGRIIDVDIAVDGAGPGAGS